MSEYPAMDGERDPANIDHWFWQNLQGKFVTRTKTVPRRKVSTVHNLIAQNTSIVGILEYLQSPLLVFLH